MRARALDAPLVEPATSSCGDCSPPAAPRRRLPAHRADRVDTGRASCSAGAARRHARRRQRVRHRRGRRQARARLRRGHGPLPPRRGAAAALRRRPTTWASPPPVRALERSTSSSSSRARPRRRRRRRRPARRAARTSSACARRSRDPGRWVAQETIPLSPHPTVCDGALAPRTSTCGRSVPPRRRGRGPARRADPCRAARGAMVVNSSQDGGAKDTWVLSAG